MKLTQEQRTALENNGWSIIGDAPLHLFHSATASAASGLAASMVIDQLLKPEPTVSPLDELVLLHGRVERNVQRAFLCEKTNKELGNPKEGWRIAYGKIFNDSVSGRIWKLLDQLGLRLEYCDPNMGYDDDVLAFSRAMDRLMRTLQEEGKLD